MFSSYPQITDFDFASLDDGDPALWDLLREQAPRFDVEGTFRLHHPCEMAAAAWIVFQHRERSQLCARSTVAFIEALAEAPKRRGGFTRAVLEAAYQGWLAGRADGTCGLALRWVEGLSEEANDLQAELSLARIFRSKELSSLGRHDEAESLLEEVEFEVGTDELRARIREIPRSRKPEGPGLGAMHPRGG